MAPVRSHGTHARRGVLAATLIVAALTSPERARAQASASDKAAAEALFDEGRQLMDSKDYALACTKFETSQRLAAGIGTLLYLADCYEKSGRTASAWATFREASSKANAAGQQDRAHVASERAAAIEPRLSKLRVRISAEVPGLEVRRGGVVVGREIWGAPVPVDPGSYLIEASAPGKNPWSTRYEVPAQPGAFEVVVPALTEAPQAAAPAAPPGGTAPPTAATTGQRGADTPPPATRSGDTQRIVGVAVGGLGVVGLGIGVGFTLRAASKDSEADDHCDGTVCRDETGPELSDQARAAGNVATVALVVGAAAVAGGLVLYLTAPRSRAGASAAALPHPTPPPRTWIRADARGVVGCGGTW